MQVYKVNQIYANGHWHSRCTLRVSDEGLVHSIDTDQEGDEFNDILIPSFINGHSHAFQYAMAGRAEKQLNPSDDFWTWRETMYKLAQGVDDQMFKDIAVYVYQQMLNHGYSAVTEFHYLHRTDLSENLRRCQLLAEAAAEVKINITIVPMFYHFGGFGKKAEKQQEIFKFDSAEKFIEAVIDLKQKFDSPVCKIGIGVHSLRAADKEQIKSILSTGIAPFHIHISEQQKEVEDCLKFYEKRPVEWLLEQNTDHVSLNLVHATHINDQEIAGIVDQNANIIICPSTEANLGDGIFPADKYKEHSGTWTIGSDSHINLNPFEELRLIEYGQRLTKEKRTVLCDSTGSNAKYLFDSAVKGGAIATAQGFKTDIAVGSTLNALLLDENHPNLLQKKGDEILASLIFSSDVTTIKSTLVSGVDRKKASTKEATNQYTKALKAIFG